MQTIEQTYNIKTPLGKVWEALTNADIIEQWGGGPSAFDAHNAGKFSLWGGEIFGVNTPVEPHKLIEEDWHSTDHPGRSYKVSFSLDEKDGTTTVTLKHAGVTAEEAEDFGDGWQTYYLGPLKKLHEA